MQFDRPWRTRDAIGRLGAFDNVGVHQRFDARNLPRLTDTDLHTGVVDELILAANELVAEETRVFAHLTTALDLGVAEVLPE